MGEVSSCAVWKEEEGEVEKIPRWKRFFDVFLIVLFAPVWLSVVIGIAVWIRSVSPGPVFFGQERVGQQKKRFRILKFRSMHVNAETKSHERYFQELVKSNGPMTKLDATGDPRLIKGGRAIRALGLDELPQLINILRGEMSLVGPRPCTVRELETYETWQHERFDARPGLTGYWQVNGKNETTFTEMVNMDIYYARRMSVRLDCVIIAKTFPTLIRQLRMHCGTKRHSGLGNRGQQVVAPFQVSTASYSDFDRQQE